MAYGSGSSDVMTYPAAADLTGKQFFCVILNASAQAALAGAAVRILGVLQNAPTAGQGAAVQFDDVTKAVAGGAVAAGAQLTTDASGRVITAAAGNVILGIAEQAAGAAGDIIAVNLARGGGVA